MIVLPFSSSTTIHRLHSYYYKNKFPFPHLIRWSHTTMDSSITTTTQRRGRKVLVIMGPTGSGKSRLSVDLATRFFNPSEIINSDKIQLYRGLDITTNKISMSDRRGVPHHLLGEFDPTDPHHVTPSDFRKIAASRISDITCRRKLPIVVGGSNSLIHALLPKRFDPDTDVFYGSDPVNTELRYNCCLLWMDVSLPVLNQYLSKRVDEMLDMGMFDELAEFFDSGESESVNRDGLGQAIGVPEFERYFKTFGGCRENNNVKTEVMRKVWYEEAVKKIKDNTCQLAKRQVGKILRLKDAGWDLKRIDATEVFRVAMSSETGGGGGGGERVSEIWEKQVIEPSVKIVKRFLEE